MKLKLLWRTLSVTTNPLVLLSLKRTGTRKSITFKNGLALSLTWPQFRIIRDNYSLLSKHKLTQVGDDLFKIADDRSEITCKSDLIPMMFDLLQDYTLHHKDGVYYLKSEKFELLGSLAMLFCVRELKSGEYESDYKDKVVLDIGGFEGESAAYFWQRGARKIVIYEPVAEHVEAIKRNINFNHIEAEIHQSGVGTRDGLQIINYEETDPGFGMLSTGLKQREIQINQTSKVIVESGADIAKFDCEGGEQSLVDVPAKVLQRISFYIVEVHSPQIRAAIIEKFQGSGFALVREVPKPPTQFSVLTFKRVADKK